MFTDLLKDAKQNIEFFLSTSARSRSRSLVNQEVCAPSADRVAFRNFHLVVSKVFKIYRNRVIYINLASSSVTTLPRNVNLQQTSCDIPSMCTRNCKHKVSVDMSDFKQNWKMSTNPCTIHQKRI